MPYLRERCRVGLWTLLRNPALFLFRRKDYHFAVGTEALAVGAHGGIFFQGGMENDAQRGGAPRANPLPSALSFQYPALACYFLTAACFLPLLASFFSAITCLNSVRLIYHCCAIPTMLPVSQ